MSSRPSCNTGRRGPTSPLYPLVALIINREGPVPVGSPRIECENPPSSVTSTDGMPSNPLLLMMTCPSQICTPKPYHESEFVPIFFKSQEPQPLSIRGWKMEALGVRDAVDR